MGFEQMTPYEQQAWRQSIKVLFAPPRRKIIPAQARQWASSAAASASSRLSDLPGAESAVEIAEKAFEGTLALTFQPASDA